jgi:transposase
VSSRKATVAKAVIAGLIGEEEAIARFQLSNEELQGWVSAYQKSGERELKATRPFKR